MKNALKGKNLAYTATIVFALILVLTLFVFRYGVSDNGDLTGRLEHLGLYDALYDSGAGSGEYPTLFGVMGMPKGFSTADLPYRAIMLVSPAVPVAVPAAIYAILLLMGVFLIIRTLLTKYDWNNILLAALCVLFFADSGYTAFLNTPYTEAAAFVYLTLSVGTLLWAVNNKGILPYIAAGISCILFAGVSATTAWISFLTALFFVILLIKNNGAAKKVVCAMCAVLVVLTSLFTLAGDKPSDSKLFDSIFYGVALETPGNAVQMGISEQDAKALWGKASFDADALSYLADNSLSDKFSYKDVSMFYLSHPSVYIENAKKVANNSVMINTEYLENYPYGSGKGAEQGKFFKLYSSIKPRMIPSNLAILAVLLIGLFIGTLFYRKKYAETDSAKRVCDLVLLGVIASVIAFNLPLIYGGLVQIGFYMHLYNQLFDFCLLALIVGGTKLLWKRREALKEKYGVNQ